MGNISFSIVTNRCFKKQAKIKYNITKKMQAEMFRYLKSPNNSILKFIFSLLFSMNSNSPLDLLVVSSI